MCQTIDEHQIAEVQSKMRQLEQCHEPTKKPILLNEANSLYRKLQHSVDMMLPCYQKSKLQKQLEVAGRRLQRLEAQMMEQIRFYRISKAHLEESQYKYDPRKTVEQNMLRSVIWMELHEKDMMIKNQQIEDIARRMEDNKEVVEEIQRLVKRDGEKLDIITSRIHTAHRNVVEANKQLEEANVLQGGLPRIVEEKEEESAMKRSSQESSEPKEQNKSSSAIVKGLRSKVRGFFGNIGYSISHFFGKIFHKN